MNAASIAGIVGAQNNGPYMASKHAIIGLTQTMAKEEGIRATWVNAIALKVASVSLIHVGYEAHYEQWNYWNTHDQQH